MTCEDDMRRSGKVVGIGSHRVLHTGVPTPCDIKWGVCKVIRTKKCTFLSGRQVAGLSLLPARNASWH
eukprot:1176089-Prorocentrum_minimum.AAC.6